MQQFKIPHPFKSNEHEAIDFMFAEDSGSGIIILVRETPVVTVLRETFLFEVVGSQASICVGDQAYWNENSTKPCEVLRLHPARQDIDVVGFVRDIFCCASERYIQSRIRSRRVHPTSDEALGGSCGDSRKDRKPPVVKRKSHGFRAVK